MLCLIILPLAISTYFENVSDLLKSASLEFFSGAFIIFSCFVIIKSCKTASEINLFDKALDPFVLQYFLSAVFSTLFSISPVISFHGQYLRQIGLITFIYLVLVYLLSSNLLRNTQNRKYAFLMMEIVGMITVIEAILQVLKNDPLGLQPQNVVRPVSTLGNSVFFSEFLILIFPFSALNLSQKKNKISRILIPLVLFVGIIISQTRSSYIAVIMEIFVLLICYLLFFKLNNPGFKSKARTYLFIIAGTVTLVFLIGVIFQNNVYVQRFVTIFSQGNNPRFILWKDSFEMAKNFLVTGAGIGMFPAAFENFYSFDLKFADTIRTFDHAHNNFIHTLCTMGLLGLVSYILLIARCISMSLKGLKISGDANENKIFYLAFLSMLSGYIIYGMTNFDDIPAMFYLFIFLGMLKVAYNRDFPESISKINVLNLKVVIIPVILIVIVFCFYNFYLSFNELKADRYYRTSFNLQREGKFTETVNTLNEAIKYNPICWQYRMTLSNVVYSYASETALNKQAKDNLLNQVIEEIARARMYPFINSRCDGLLSLVYYGLGRTDEADSIKNTLLLKDPIAVDYRVQLSRYYYRNGNISELAKNYEVISKYRPNTMAEYIAAAMYNMKIGNKDGVIVNCGKILQIEPDNKFALNLLQELNKN
jgi:putative inorganic carbon (HCO3(-)) transporter